MIIYQVTYESPVNGTQVCFFTKYEDAVEFGDVFTDFTVEPCVLHNRSFVVNRVDEPIPVVVR
jgi:hypothetical protein